MTEQEAQNRINQSEQEIKTSYQNLLRAAEQMGNEGREKGYTAINTSEDTKNPCITGFIGIALIAIGIIMVVISEKSNAVTIYGSTPLFIGIIILVYQVFSGSSRFTKVSESNNQIKNRRKNRTEELGKARERLQSSLRDNRKI